MEQRMDISLRSGNLNIALLSSGDVAIMPTRNIKNYIEYVNNLTCVFDNKGVTFILELDNIPVAEMPKEEYVYNERIKEYKQKPLLLMWLKSLQLGE